jgi:2-polyprenyl-3-methyl-5-hydroxy-6-metoxy-1,4-benzoquinol methylase
MNNGQELKSEQKNQEGEYWFPYHYVAQYKDNNFRHCYLDAWGINYVSTIEFLLGKIRSETHKTIVDIGCGDGRFSRELALADTDCQVTGIDYSKKAIGLASAMNSDIENLTFRSIDITGSHGLECFDSAILMEVFEHIPLSDTGRFMSGVRGLLKDGGTLHLTVPHENRPLDDMHFQHFSVEKLLGHLKGKFEVVEVIPFERIALSRRIVLWLLSNKFFILNNARLLSLVYRYYKRKLFISGSEKNCQRIYVKARAV